MARSNRLQVPDGTYHVTTRFVNREFWLEDPKLKDRFVEDLYCVARFSGVDLLSWTVMDNHLHLFVRVPPVPLMSPPPMPRRCSLSVVKWYFPSTRSTSASHFVQSKTGTESSFLSVFVHLIV